MTSFNLITSLQIQSHSGVVWVRTSTYEFGDWGDTIQPITKSK